MGELGTRLREARESRGLSLQQVEEVTRIRFVFLEALEEERFDDLPGDVYAMGFIRNYAQFLGLDPQELLASFKAARGQFPLQYVPKVLDEPLVPRQGGNRLAAIFLALMLLAVLALGAWYAYQRFYLGVEPGSMVIPQLIPIGEEPTATVTVEPTVATATSAPDPRIVEAVRSPSLEATHSVPTVTPAPSSTCTSSPSPLPCPTVTQSSSPSASATPTESTPIRVEATALDTTWLRVYLDGELVFGNFLQQGENRAWEAQREISIRIGNAGGLRLTVNGVEVGSLGEPGEVVVVEYALDSLPEG